LLWHVAIDGVVLAAEYTTNTGPWADDYFLIFVEADHDKLYLARASLYSNGIYSRASVLRSSRITGQSTNGVRGNLFTLD
jgi:hypothetical protein